MASLLGRRRRRPGRGRRGCGRICPADGGRRRCRGPGRVRTDEVDAPCWPTERVAPFCAGRLHARPSSTRRPPCCTGRDSLAVFLAGIVIGDARAPYKLEIERFASGIASVSEIVAFAVLGLSVSLRNILNSADLLIGLALAGLLILIIRPVLVGLLSGPCPAPARGTGLSYFRRAEGRCADSPGMFSSARGPHTPRPCIQSSSSSCSSPLSSREDCCITWLRRSEGADALGGAAAVDPGNAVP